MAYISNTDEDRKTMLQEIGVKSFEDLINNIPEKLRLKEEIKILDGLSELEVFKLMKKISAENCSIDDYVSFLGGGAYDHYIPSAINHIASRPEFYTAYTPYQPEVSQGTLQTIYEYQSMICELTEMDVANASLYDGGSSSAEAVLMACSMKGKNKIMISDSLNPFYKSVIKTYCYGQGIVIKELPTENGTLNLEILEKSISEEYAGIVIQHPNFFGCLEDVFSIEKIVHSAGGLFMTVVDPISLGILNPPGKYNADIVCGEAQSLGNEINFGGPYIGIIATKSSLVRRMPGRIIGRTVDLNGNIGYVMTLQTREQHIRREKATSNICTNQALNALSACVYLTLLGKQGIKEVAYQCLQKSHYLSEKLSSIDGYKMKFDKPFFKEFTFETKIDPEDIIKTLYKRKIFAGINLKRFGFKNLLLIAVTEKRTREEMDIFIEEIKKL
jgi:glycine dehydrogenase subunit 1